jgi:hypothetical protein
MRFVRELCTLINLYLGARVEIFCAVNFKSKLTKNDETKCLRNALHLKPFKCDQNFYLKQTEQNSSCQTPFLE